MSSLRPLLAALILLSGAASAQISAPRAHSDLMQGFDLGGVSGGAPQTNDKLSLSALASVQAYESGKPFFIAAEVQIQEPWHAYFRNPGSIGLPMELALNAPAGFKVEGPFWQPPHRVEGLYTSYAYERKAIAVWKVTPEAGAPAEASFAVSGTAQLCCETGCDQPADIGTELTLAAGAAEANAAWQQQEQRVERLGDSPLTVTATQDTDSVTLRLEGSAAGDIRSAYFFSDDSNIAPQTEQTLSRDGDAYTLKLTRNDGSEALYPLADETQKSQPLARLSGILSYNDSFCTVDIDLSQPSAADNAAAPSSDADKPAPSDQEETADLDGEASGDQGEAAEPAADASAADKPSTPAPGSGLIGTGLGNGSLGTGIGGSPFGSGVSALPGADSGAADAATGEKLSLSALASVQAYESGKPFFIAAEVQIQEPWHAYFRNPGSIGLPMELALNAPAGFKVEGPFWQPPHRVEGLYTSYAYERKAIAVWKVTPEAGAPAEASFAVSGTAQLCCETGCDQPADIGTELTLAAGAAEANAAWQQQEQRVERLGDSPLTVTATQDTDSVTLRLEGSAAGDIRSAYFFSDDSNIAPQTEQTLSRDGDAYTLKLTRNDGSEALYPLADETQKGQPLARLSGILSYNDSFCTVDIDLSQPSTADNAAAASGDKAAAGDANKPEPSAEEAAGGKGEAPASDTAAAASAEESPALSVPAGFATIIGSLFLGGLILNLMPCVFPVIGLKIMSFVEMGGGDRRKVFVHSLAFSLGILVSFWILALLIVIFTNLDTFSELPWTQWFSAIVNDSGSSARSWASWMQNPWVVYVLVLLLITLGLSMFGLFEIGVSATGAGQNLQNKGGLTGSFFQGLFVTVVATPCSGPCLGTALPAAMAMPGMWMILALTFMALGLASPYIVMGLFPALASKLPRPGAWMESLKQALSFLLFAAAGWFLVVYLAFVPDAESAKLPWMLMSLVVYCAAWWVYGRWCPLYRSKRSRVIGLVVALALAFVGVKYSMPVFHYDSDEAIEAAKGEAGYILAQGEHPVWNTWSSELMNKALNDGHPVYVDFTATWCGTCQVNKQVAYTKEVCELFEKNGVVLMRADKTKPSPAIDAELRRLKRGSVPTNALYLPAEPAVTAEVLTPGYMVDFLNSHLSNNQ